MSDRNFIILSIGVGFVILLGSYFLIAKTPKGKVEPVKIASYNLTDKQKPKASVSQTFADLGEMKVSDEKAYDFAIKNAGEKPLQLSNITTSCGCTVAQVIYKGQKSEEFGMHSKSLYIAEVAPGDTATVKVIYRPYVMPVYGLVEREAYVSTNDPENPKITFKVVANVK